MIFFDFFFHDHIFSNSFNDIFLLSINDNCVYYTFSLGKIRSFQNSKIRGRSRSGFGD